ncbi:ABC transporter substrate-binding protein [Microbacterium halotolerans]|uniref:ABC transporter substrate-binding protein n=1 Tax=Microbacterium halotolerans TaxID=246613 RepID=UPI0013C35C0E|nr:ABC transporter substrate-binding protein [Microbacterium halotolerans]
MSRSLTPRSAAVGLAAVGLALTGCSAAVPADAAPDADAIVDIQVGLEPTSLDISTTSGAALEMLLMPNVYQGLVDSDGEGGYVPSLASDWSVSDDGLTYAFDIRDDVVFHDGSGMTVDDVVWSLSRASGEDSVNPDAGQLSDVETVTAIDDDTVEVELSSRNSGFLGALTSNAGMILSEDSDADLALETNGTGPYTVTQWNKGSTVTLTRFDDYWGEKPENGGAVVHFISDATTAANALLAGEVDVLTTTTAETTPLFDDESQYTLTEGDSRSWMTLGINHAVEGLDDVRVRRAIRMAIDKDGLIETLGGQATRVGSMATPSDPWYEDLTDIDAYDPAAARDLLAEADAEDLELGFRVSNTYDTRISEYVAAQLGEVGIDVEIEQLEFSTWLEQVFNNHDYDLSMVLHVAPALTGNYSNPDYYWNYDDADAQRLVAESIATTDADEAVELTRELARHISEQAVSDWLYSPTTVVAARTGITGMPLNGLANRMPIASVAVAAQ